MTNSAVVKAALASADVKQAEMAQALEISPQAFRNKLTRNSFSADDLRKIAKVCGYKIAFVDDYGRAVVTFFEEEE